MDKEKKLKECFTNLLELDKRMINFLTNEKGVVYLITKAFMDPYSFLKEIGSEIVDYSQIWKKINQILNDDYYSEIAKYDEWANELKIFAKKISTFKSFNLDKIGSKLESVSKNLYSEQLKAISNAFNELANITTKEQLQGEKDKNTEITTQKKEIEKQINDLAAAFNNNTKMIKEIITDYEAGLNDRYKPKKSGKDTSKEVREQKLNDLKEASADLLNETKSDVKLPKQLWDSFTHFNFNSYYSVYSLYYDLQILLNSNKDYSTLLTNLIELRKEFKTVEVSSTAKTEKTLYSIFSLIGKVNFNTLRDELSGLDSTNKITEKLETVFDCAEKLTDPSSVYNTPSEFLIEDLAKIKLSDNKTEIDFGPANFPKKLKETQKLLRDLIKTDFYELLSAFINKEEDIEKTEAIKLIESLKSFINVMKLLFEGTDVNKDTLSATALTNVIENYEKIIADPVIKYLLLVCYELNDENIRNSGKEFMNIINNGFKPYGMQNPGFFKTDFLTISISGEDKVLIARSKIEKAAEEINKQLKGIKINNILDALKEVKDKVDEIKTKKDELFNLFGTTDIANPVIIHLKLQEYNYKEIETSIEPFRTQTIAKLDVFCTDIGFLLFKVLLAGFDPDSIDEEIDINSSEDIPTELLKKSAESTNGIIKYLIDCFCILSGIIFNLMEQFEYNQSSKRSLFNDYIDAIRSSVKSASEKEKFNKLNTAVTNFSNELGILIKSIGQIKNNLKINKKNITQIKDTYEDTMLEKKRIIFSKDMDKLKDYFDNGNVNVTTLYDKKKYTSCISDYGSALSLFKSILKDVNKTIPDLVQLQELAKYVYTLIIDDGKGENGLGLFKVTCRVLKQLRDIITNMSISSSKS
ncbi:Uncharacterised protein [Candidatus Tiddalikarchaeum anstoanum]|nr:Uncharacterised protein [Candidatus Tiddalikarchaeum anstoanum]